jgi:hypothetical protein
MQLGGRARILAPLSAGSFKMYREEINAAFKGGGVPDLEVVAKLAHASLKRNEPDVTLAEVEELVDFGNVVEIFEAVMNVSGLVASVGNMMRRLQAATAAPQA